MKRDNPKYPPWHCFTACICEKCREFYEADREHICRKKNSYPFTEPKGKTRTIPKWTYKKSEVINDGQ